jgi:membrane-bound acyltransferase YfiQ involved in biofilm formation
MRKEIFENYKNKIYLALVSFTLFIAVAFSYMTSIFWSTVQGTNYAYLTYLIAAPVLFSVILLAAVLFIGKNQILQEISEFLTGSRN